MINEVSRKRSVFHQVLSKDISGSIFVLTKKRRRLIQMVNEEGIPISKASKKLKIKLTTARLILKKYNETGEFPMRNFRKKTKPTVEPLIKKEVQEEER